MDTQGWQIVKRDTNGDLFLIKGEPGNVAAAFGPLTAETNVSMFNQTDKFTVLDRLPELEHAGGGQQRGTAA